MNIEQAKKFLRGSGLSGYIRDSFYGLKSHMDMLEDKGDIRVINRGPSADDKSRNNWVIIPRDNSLVPFIIYDYKEPIDYEDIDNADEEIDWHIGGKDGSFRSAKYLGFNPTSMIKTEAIDPIKKFKDFIQEEVELDENLDENMGSGDSDWALYVKSILNDIRINGAKAYIGMSENDIIEDFNNFIADKYDR